MDRRRILLILGAAWISAALLTWFLYASTQAPHVEPTVNIEAAAHDMPAGTLLRKQDLKTVAMSERDIPKTAIRDKAQAINRPLLFPISANEPITLSKVGAAGIDGLAATIEVGMRAITVPITDASGVAGIIPPRAHVDVLFTRTGNISEAATTTIIEDVVVLAMGRVTEAPSSSSAAATAAQSSANAPRLAQSATLLVNPEQARRIELAKNLGKISLVLRNPLDDTEVTSDLTTPEDLGIVPKPAPVRTIVERTPPKPEVKTVLVKEVPKKQVEVFRGNQHVMESVK